MSDFDENIEYIEAYFKDQLSDAEKKQFEERCVRDQVFARQVALFITMEEGIRQKLLQQKKQLWAGDENKQEGVATTSLKKRIVRKWIPYLAAACIVSAVAFYFLFRSETPRELANQYAKDHFTVLSQTMNASQDSLQQGIEAYNNKDYSRALQIFEKVYQAYPDSTNAKKFMGLVYLVTQDYDKAIEQFDELINNSDLYGRPGLFLKAIALLQRNKRGDKEQAKQLLEQVVNEKAEGSKEAEEWLRNWK